MKRLRPSFFAALALLLVLPFAAKVSFAKSKEQKIAKWQEKAKKHFKVSYDRNQDQTIVGCKPLHVYQQIKPMETAGDIDLEVCYVFKGRELKAKPAFVQLVFRSWTRSERTFSKFQSLTFTVDEKTVPVTVAGVYDLKADDGVEWLKYNLSPADFTQIANAGVLKARLGNQEFNIDDFDLVVLKEILSRINAVP